MATQKETQEQESLCGRSRREKVELGRLVIHRSPHGDIVPHRIINVEKIFSKEYDDLGYITIGDDLGKMKYPIDEFKGMFSLPTRIYELLYD